MKALKTCILATTALTVWLGMAGAASAGPAPVQQFGVSPPARNGAVTVRPGDKIETIAKMYGVSVASLATLNNLEKPYTLTTGKRLLLPMPRAHKVGRDDTLYSISRMYGVTVDDIASTNHIAPPYVLRQGQMLDIPTSSSGAPVKRLAVTKPSPVEEAETRGQSVLLKKPGPSPEHQAFDKLLEKLAGKEEAEKKETSHASSLVAQATAVPEVPDAEVVGASGRAGFIWPVRGQVISSYGPKAGGLYNDGINIAAPRGTPVKAASGGTVAYVGDKLKSYGNLVLIRHPGGMVTAYAHLSTVSVKEGTHVSTGQVIGSVGSTGTVMNAQLHFEVRRGTHTINPKEYLG